MCGTGCEQGVQAEAWGSPKGLLGGSQMQSQDSKQGGV